MAGHVIASTGEDRTLRLWDAPAARELGAPIRLEGAPTSDAALSPDGRRVAVARFAPDGAHVYAIFSNGRGYAWNVRPDTWEHHACTVAGRQLTRTEWTAALPGRIYAPVC